MLTLTTLLATAALAQDAPPPPAAAVVGTPTVQPAETVSLRLSVLPGVGLGAAPDARVDGISLGLASHAASLNGIDAELGWSWVDGPVDGVQASTGFNVAHDLDGLQLAAGANWARGSVTMGQLAGGANLAEGDVSGLQGAGFLNVATGRLSGVQASGFLNVATGSGSEGIQATGGLNVAGDLEGLQAAPMNVAGHVNGAQIGLVNVGGDVQGLQLGLVNIARTSDVSIAPLNFIGDGLHEVEVWTSESAVANVGVKFGSKYVYTLVGAGWVNVTQPWWTFGGGLGVHLPVDPLWFEIDDSAWAVASGNVLAPGVHNKLRAQVGLQLAEHLAPFAGVSINTWVGSGAVWPRAVGLPSRITAGQRIVTWPGVHAGVSF
jgi:hypothetical protein